MKTITATAVILCAAAVGWGQQSNSSSKGLGHETLSPKGNKIHYLFSGPAEAQHRAEQAAVGFAVTGTNLAYSSSHGPVMRNPTNYLIFWQPPGRLAFPAGYQAGVEKFFQNVGGTPYYNIVTQYGDTTGVPVPNAASLGAPSYTDTTTAPPSGCNGTATGTVGSTPNCPLTDGDIQNEVNVAIAANPAWTAAGINVEYFVFTPSDVGECSGLQKDGVTWNCFAITGGVGTNQAGVFCAYHSFFGGNKIYAFQPFASNGSCYPSAAIVNLGYPNSQAVDVVLGEVSHEMIESNTDPHLDAWTGTGGGDDEIGDKCNFIYGYLAPDGTNMVLNGNRFKIQEEFSNDVTACTKRYGPAPLAGNPGTLAFGEVDAGTSAQKGSLIHNNGQGDLNILNIRLLGTSPTYYSLLNGQPTASTLHSSEDLTANVRFAPASGSPFGSPGDTLVVDTDETPCAPANTSCATASTTAFASITGTVGVPPSALCKNVIVNTDNNLCSTANASVNSGSVDPDGESITLNQSPAGPYTLGTTNVILTATDTSPDHASASCPATVTVQDKQNPNISCPLDQTVKCTSPSGAAATITPTFSDNCPAVTASCAPPSGSTFGFGTTSVTCTATDGSGNTNACTTHVTVQDVAPTIASVVAFPNVLTPPNKKLDPVVITVKDTDPCDPAPVCSITGVTANVPINPSMYNITGPLTLSLQANGNGGHTLTYVVSVACTTAHGTSTAAQVSVSAPAH
ncbi:MAG: hypothetical protein JWO19_2138 [Bryobacterales bacterium]|nr:hypothetical protein [Bryobacterales bacterium]